MGENGLDPEFDSFTDLDAIGEEPTSKITMYFTIGLLVAVIAAGGIYFFYRFTDRSREFERNALVAAADQEDASDEDDGDRVSPGSEDDSDHVEPVETSTPGTDAAVDEGGIAEAGVEPGVETGVEEQVEAGVEESADAGEVEETDAGEVEETDAGEVEAVEPVETAEPTPEQRRESRQLANRALFIAERDREQALEMARRATGLDPSQSVAWYVIAFVENEQGNQGAAREALERCLENRSIVSGDCRSLQRRLAE